MSRVVANGTVWGLKGENGWAVAEANDDSGASVLLFWSDEAYARRAQQEFPDHTLSALGLFDFLYRWLPGMSEDGVLAGTNWTGDLVGVEADPFDLRTEIEGILPPEVAEEYRVRYAAAAGRKQ